MGLTEIFWDLSEKQKSNIALDRARLSKLFESASDFSRLGDINRAAQLQKEAGELLESINFRSCNASRLTDEILPKLLDELGEMGITEPSVEEIQQSLEVKGVGTEEGKSNGRKRNPNVLSERQAQIVRVGLRLTDQPRDNVSFKDLVYEVIDREEIGEDYQLAIGRIAGCVKWSLGKLSQILESVGEFTLPLSIDEIATLPVDNNIRQILHRASLIPAYSGLTMSEVINYCGSLNHKRINLLEPIATLGSDRKVYLVRQLLKLSLASTNDRAMLLSFLQGQEGNSVNLPEAERQKLCDEIVKYLKADTEVADGLWDQMDEDQQILVATLVRYLHQEVRPKTDKSWESLVAGLLEVGQSQ